MKLIPYFFVLFQVAALFAAQPFEQIVAVVDKDIILYSDLMDAAEQLRNAPGYGSLPTAQLHQKVLQRLIDDKVIMVRAQKDSLDMSEEEVQARVTRHLQTLAARQNMDLPTLEKAIAQQWGADYRKKLADQVREQGVLQQVQMRYVGRIAPTRKEVTAFYNEYKDSLPTLYDVVRVGYMRKDIKPSTAVVDSVKKAALALVDSLILGVPFDSLAMRHSQHSSAVNGGDMGFFHKGSSQEGLVETEYERAAFRLQLGKYTELPVKSESGFYIIKKLAERDNQIRTAQIFLPTPATPQDSLRSFNLLDSLESVVKQSADSAVQVFKQLARQYSDDEKAAINNGDLGWFQRNDLDTAYHKIVNPLQEGQLSGPVMVNGSWYLFYIMDYESQRTMRLEDNYAEIEQIAISIMSNRKLETFVENWRKQVYIDIRWPQK